MKEEKKFSIKAVLFGLMVDIGGTFVLFLIPAFLAIWKVYSTSGSTSNMEERVPELLSTSLPLLLMMVIIGSFMIMTGGYITARCAHFKEIKHAFVMGVLHIGTGCLIDMAFPVDPKMPIWVTWTEYISAIPLAVLGGYLYVSRKTPEQINEPQN